jgi:putative PIN family toxin of toxin-antitoxin system
MRKIKVLLDSSVIITGLASANGGSHKVLALAELGLVTPCISADVESEVLRNVAKKLPKAVAHFERLMQKISFIVIETSKQDVDEAELMVNKHDAPIMAAAISAEVNWLLSLDRHFLALKRKGALKFIVATPEEFLQHLADFLREQC